MRNFLKITKEELEKIKSYKISVYEKLDMVYFKVIITGGEPVILSAKGRKLSDVDFIINSINRDIRDFVDTKIKPVNDKLFEDFGGCKIGFFYLPVHKTKSIDYYCMNEKTFIFSDLYTDDKSKNNIERLLNILGEDVLKQPLITELDGLDNDDIKNIFECISDNDYMKLASMFTDSKTYTGLELYEIEGLVLCFGKHKYQLTINGNDFCDDMFTRKLYRDTVIENFASSIIGCDVDALLESDKTPAHKVCDLFLEYMNCTNLFSKTYIENDDLLPPHDGYIGDIDWNILPSTVKLVCKNDEKYKNILRILFSVLMCDNIEIKVKDFNQMTKDVILKINFALTSDK